MFLLPKEGQPVTKSKGSHTFSTLHVECLHVVLNKNMKTDPFLVQYYLKQTMFVQWCDLSEHILGPIYVEIQVIPKISHTFSC